MSVRYLLDKSAAYRSHIPAVRERLGPLMGRGLLLRCGITDLEAGVSARSADDYAEVGQYRRDALDYLTTPDVVWDRASEVQQALAADGYIGP